MKNILKYVHIKLKILLFRKELIELYLFYRLLEHYKTVFKDNKEVYVVLCNLKEEMDFNHGLSINKNKLIRYESGMDTKGYSFTATSLKDYMLYLKSVCVAQAIIYKFKKHFKRH